MSRRITSAPRAVRRFVANQEGVATVDWVLVCCSATAAGMMAMNMGQDSLGPYSSDVRAEVQGPYFQAAWTEQMDIPPQEFWGAEGQIVPNFEQQGDVSTSGGNETLTTVVNGNGNGNNGHGNDGDGCDSSNIGNNPNCAGDTTDNDGTPPGQTPDSGTTTATTTTNGSTTTTTTTGGSGTTPGGMTPTGGAVVTTQTGIAIVNSGFETTDNTDGQWSSGVPGWLINAEGSADVGDFNPNQLAIDESTVTGDNVAFLFHEGGSNVASMWQTFGEFYTAGDTYEFAVDIGDGAYSFSGDQPFALNIFAGSTVIGTASGTTRDIDSIRTVSVTSTLNDASLDGQPITFEIVNPIGAGGDLLIENVVGTVISQTIVMQTNIVTSPIQGCPDPC
ncbi:hypothetical protein HKCCSP123_12630 [Rhodobacterales bacterium HKCCSP123]|nr:hypothetical protein [Rhodobacterales bacterium HKCCSP123]